MSYEEFLEGGPMTAQTDFLQELIVDNFQSCRDGNVTTMEELDKAVAV